MLRRLECFEWTQSERLQKLQNRAARLIANLPNECIQETALNALDWEPLKEQWFNRKQE